LDFDSLSKEDDAAFVKEVSKLPDVGSRTGEMLLIRVLKRPDVIRDKGFAILRGMRMVYRVSEVTPEFFAKKRALYSPYATMTSIYFWAISSKVND